MGRLFDAVSALLGVCATATYEGQPAIELEALADRVEMGYYPIALSSDRIDITGMWPALLEDWRSGMPLPILSARFHNSIAHLVLDAARNLRERTGCATAALSGGVWQNRLLLERSLRLLQDFGFTVLLHRQTPANDGGVALGQAVIAARTLDR